MEETKKNFLVTPERETKNKPSKIVITNQNTIALNGISKVISSTQNEISVVINGQTFCITGSNLCVSKLDVETGILEATGEVHQMKFSGHKQKENIFKRVFG